MVQHRNARPQERGYDCLSFSDWPLGADDRCHSVAVASTALSGNLDRLKDIFESDDCSIFTQRPGVAEAELPDALQHWTPREYVELAVLRAARGSSRRQSLQAVLLWMEEAFDFASAPMEEDLDDLRTLTLKGKPSTCRSRKGRKGCSSALASSHCSCYPAVCKRIAAVGNLGFTL